MLKSVSLSSAPCVRAFNFFKNMDKTLDGHLIENLGEDKFEFYRSFQFQEDALPFIDLLKENEIPYKFDGSETLITEAIVGSPNYPKYVLKILRSDISTVNSIIEDEVLRFYGDIKKVKKVFNWYPKTNFKKGLNETIKFYENYLKRRS